MRDPWGYQKLPGANFPMHPFVEDVHRTDPIPVRPIATGATCHFVVEDAENSHIQDSQASVCGRG